MAFQTSVPQNPPIGTVGAISDTSYLLDVITIFAEVDSVAGSPLEDSSLGILPGQLLVRGSNYDEGRLPHALAADVDSIIVAGVSAAAPQDLGPTDFDGATSPNQGVGPNRFPLPTKITMTLSNSVDWDATTATLTGYDQTGALVSETLNIPDTGNTTLTTTGTYTQVTRLQIDAQSGPGGTYTLGVTGPADAVLTKAQIHGVVLNGIYREGGADLNGIPSGASGTPYKDTEDMAVVRTGRMWVRTENAVTPGAPAFARIVNSAAAGSPSNLGQFRADADGGNAILVPGARYKRVDGTIAEIEINFRD